MRQGGGECGERGWRVRYRGGGGADSGAEGGWRVRRRGDGE